MLHRAKSFIATSLALLPFAASALLLLASCLVLSDFDVHQCTLDKDCDSGDPQVRHCRLGRCATGCSDNENCATHDPRFPICSAPSGDCVSLSSSDAACYADSGFESASAAHLTARDMVLIGGFAPTVRSTTWLTLELASEEINSQWGALRPGGHPPVVAVLCKSAFASVEASLDHLVHELSVSAVVASLEEQALHSAIDDAATQGQSLFVSPGGRDSWNSPGPPSDLVWYGGGDYVDVAPAYVDLLRQAVTALEAQGRDSNMLRVAWLVSAALEDRDLATQVIPAIEVEGADGDTLARAGRLVRFDVPEDSSAAIVGELIGFAPDVVLMFAGGRSEHSPYAERSSVIAKLEAELAANAGPLPFYVFGPRNGEDAGLSQLAAASPSFRQRAVGLTADPSASPVVADSLRARFAAAYPELAGDGGNEPAFSVYDAFYDVAYASIASLATGQALAPRLLGLGIERLSDASGSSVEVAQPDTLSALLTGGTASRYALQGTTGPLLFDADRHVRSMRSHVYCWLSNGQVAGTGAVAAQSGGLDVNGAACDSALLSSGASP